MPLSLDTPIRAEDILSVTLFKPKKVYKLSGHHGDAIVVKHDGIQDAQYKTANTVVKAIDPAVKVKILRDWEVSALRFHAEMILDTVQYMRQVGALRPEDAVAENVAKDLRSSIVDIPMFSWVKMAFVNTVTLEDALEARGRKEKTELRDFTATLNGPDGLEKLGRVVAMDMVTGNTDRFFPVGRGGPMTIGPFSFNVRTLVNIGNVFKIILPGSPTAVMTGLDFVDPNSQFKTNGADIVRPDGTKWPVCYLVDRAARKKFAGDIVADLEAILHPKKHAFSLKRKLVSNAAARLEAGMVAGARAIVDRWRTKYHAAGMPPQMQLRCKYLDKVA